ncbi:hypothetical protein MKEN_01423500 [Mycena kentingensis (nom. inval.)]|nr:hypothetical protein MKEN_01423500 [Mycena kentingensis (nom. inval.)]
MTDQPRVQVDTAHPDKSARYRSAQHTQDEEDEKNRRQASNDLTQSWLDRLQLISVITTFFASTEAGMLQVSAGTDDAAGQVVNSAFLGALVLHVWAAILSFLGAFFVVRYRLKEAREEQKEVTYTASPTQAVDRSGTDFSLLRAPRSPKLQAVWTTNPHVEEVGPFQRKPPTHLLSKIHNICILITFCGFALALLGILAFARRARDEELDASMACVGVTPSPPSTPSSPLRAPRRTRSSQMNAHPYARPSSAGPQAPKRRALSLTLGLNLNVAQLVAEEEEDDACGGILSCLSAPAKLTPSLSTASLENCPLSLLSSSTSSYSSSSLSAISMASWPPSSASCSSDSSGLMTHGLPSPSISDCGRYTAPSTSPHDSEDPPPPSGIPLRADDPTLAPFLSSQPSFSSLTTNIAIGDLAFAEDAKGLEREGITHIISVLGGRVLIPDCIPVENRLHVPLPDAPFAELVGALKPVAAWVQTAFAQGGVSLSGTPRCGHDLLNAKPVRILIHCAHGISRSPAVGAALLVAFPLVETGDAAKLETLSATAALEYVGARRPAADVNWGFRAQLSEWEQLCRNRMDG